jgi:radical SAM protein with 4Fe4S-binding SPASM domain
VKEQVIQEDCLTGEQSDINRYLAKAAQSRVPLSVSFELTRRCSFRCVHCYLGDQKSIRAHQSQELDTGTVSRLIDEMAAAGVLFLTLTGGDPMLRPDFIDIYRHAVRSGLLVTVFCNGSLITDEIVSTFVEYPPRAVEITLYGASQEIFETVTQTPGSYAACMRGVEKLRQAKVRLRLKTMALTLNRVELPQLWHKAEEMGVQFRHDCSIIPALPNGDNGGRSNIGDSLQDTLRFRLLPEQAADADFSIAQVRERLLERIAKAASVEPSNKLYRCGAARSSCHVTPYGVMQPCLITLHPAIDLQDSGQSFETAWKNINRTFPEQEYQEGFPCNDCEDRNVCTGCPSNFAAETGDAQQVPEFYCQYAISRKKVN